VECAISFPRIVPNFSTVYDDMAQQGCQEWDVSGFLLEGKPFERAAVKCWLDCAYSVLHGKAELDAADLEQLSTVHSLRQVLAFAHAVGSPDGIFSAICSQLDDLKLKVQLSPPNDQHKYELELGSCIYSGGQYYEDSEQFFRSDLTGCTEVGRFPDFEEHLLELKVKVAQQVGGLLYVAHQLQLQPLLHKLHDFIFWSTQSSTSVLYGVLQMVFTDEVLEVALGNSTLSKETYISSVLARPITPAFKSGSTGLFKAIDPTTGQSGALSFRAQLLQDFAGRQRGEHVDVTLELPTYGHLYPSLVIDAGSHNLRLPAQLLIGGIVQNESELHGVMSSALMSGASF